ncbi:MAG: permease [Anaerolineaceae bacterium]|nr:MAG: permease [Anaerolineaceae bacterium]
MAIEQPIIGAKSPLRDSMMWLAGFGVAALVMAILLSSTDNPAAAFSNFTTRFLGLFIEAVPFLLLGVFVSGLLEVYVTREDIVRWLPRNPILATGAGALMGFVFPVCECGVVPVTRRLFSKGLAMSVGVAFLLAAPVMNPIVMVSTYIAFSTAPSGTEIIIFRFVITALIALAVGLLFALAARPHQTLRPMSLNALGQADTTLSQRPRTVREGFYRSMRVSVNDFFEMGRFLVIGAMLAAGMQTFISQSALQALGEGPLLSVLVMQALAFLLSVCSTVDAFLALSFTTFSTGSILAFLTFGPMADIKSMLMYLAVFKPRVVAYMILLPFLMTLLIGLWINLFAAF